MFWYRCSYLSFPIRLGCTWGRASGLCMGAAQTSLSTSDRGPIERLPETGQCPPVLRGFQVFAHCLGWPRDVTSLLSPACRGLASALESSLLSSHTAVFLSQRTPLFSTSFHKGPGFTSSMRLNPSVKSRLKLMPSIKFSRTSPDGLSSLRLSSGRSIQLCQESPPPSSVPLSWQDHQKR